jgi:hypothetical protein
MRALTSLLTASLVREPAAPARFFGVTLRMA